MKNDRFVNHVIALIAASGIGISALGDEPNWPPMTAESTAVATLARAVEPETAAEGRSAKPAPAAQTPVRAQVQAPVQTAAPVQPEAVRRSDGAIFVPSNTLGPGLPMWIVREREQAESRLVTAHARHAEARADLAAVDAQRAAEQADRAGVVIYGPHRPGVWRAVYNRPVPPVRPRGVQVGVTQPVDDDDPFAAAQRQFFEASYPRIGPSVEAQLDAQRRINAMSEPPVAELQKQRDDAQLRLRKSAPKPK